MAEEFRKTYQNLLFSSNKRLSYQIPLFVQIILKFFTFRPISIKFLFRFSHKFKKELYYGKCSNSNSSRWSGKTPLSVDKEEE